MNTTHRLPPSDTDTPVRIFRASNVDTATETLIAKLKNGGSMSSILRSFYPEEIDQILNDIQVTSTNISPVNRRFLLKNTDESILLPSTEWAHKKIILVIDYIFSGVGNVDELFYGFIDITNHQIRETVDIYYPEYASNIDIEKLIAGIRSIRNGQQTRESFLKNI